MFFRQPARHYSNGLVWLYIINYSKIKVDTIQTEEEGEPKIKNQIFHCIRHTNRKEVRKRGNNVKNCLRYNWCACCVYF